MVLGPLANGGRQSEARQSRPASTFRTPTSMVILAHRFHRDLQLPVQPHLL